MANDRTNITLRVSEYKTTTFEVPKEVTPDQFLSIFGNEVDNIRKRQEKAKRLETKADSFFMGSEEPSYEGNLEGNDNFKELLREAKSLYAPYKTRRSIENKKAVIDFYDRNKGRDRFTFHQRNQLAKMIGVDAWENVGKNVSGWRKDLGLDNPKRMSTGNPKKTSTVTKDLSMAKKTKLYKQHKGSKASKEEKERLAKRLGYSNWRAFAQVVWQYNNN